MFCSRKQHTRILICFAAVIGVVASYAAAKPLQWPIPSRAFFEGAPYESFTQPTASGNPHSALFGCTRNDGNRFHEGLDIAPELPRRRGEATDPILAVADGVVVYVNSIAGHSSYGRYVIVRHDRHQPAFHSLYAHLRSIDVAAGDRVAVGDQLGIMGRSASYTIPRERAHLHLEFGLRLADDFQSWFDRQNFGSENHHGHHNGMNLVGWDPLDFYTWQQAEPEGSVLDYLRQLPVGFIVQVRYSGKPNFLLRYPELWEGIRGEGDLAGWEVHFTPWGLPLRWEALAADQPVVRMDPGEVRLDAVQPEALSEFACRAMVDRNGGRYRIGSGGQRVLQLLFGFESR